MSDLRAQWTGRSPARYEDVVEPGEQLFRHESGRIVAALTRIFGLNNLALAEDVMQDVFCRALEVWKLRGVPDNPAAWLMKSAKNRAIDLLRRERTARNLVPELVRELESEWTLVPTVSGFFSAETIKDDELRMMFSCCDPSLPQETQIALTLNILCGFSAAEIAGNFLVKQTAVEKRIERGKKALAASKKLFDIDDCDLSTRLPGVQHTLYLLFNEGYQGASKRTAVRSELCRDAMRLAGLLLEHPRTSSPESFALCALMYLHAARLPARVSGRGELIALADQDRDLWDGALITKGNVLLDRAATGSLLSEYHVEAAIASVHSSARSAAQTDWAKIIWLYDTLMTIRPSPVIALNRAIAIAQQSGPERGIAEINAITLNAELAAYPFSPQPWAN